MRRLYLRDEIRMAFYLLIKKRTVNSFPYQTPEAIRDYQFRKIKILLENVYEHVPFYYKKYRSAGLHPDDIKTLDDFVKIPTITKNDLIEHNDEFIDRRVRKKDLIISRSSGTSGQFINLYFDSMMFIHQELQVIRMIRELYPLYNCFDKEVLVYTSKYPVSSILGLYKAYCLNSLSNPEHIFNFILEKKPAVIAIYPSILLDMVMNIQYDYALLNLKLIITNSEQSSQVERDYFEKIFGCKVIDEFSSEELQSIAYQCKYNEYHEVSDCTYIEILGKDSNYPVPIDSIGEITGTCLINNSMPIIRYRQGDFAIRSNSQCSCGKKTPIIGKPLGRENSSFVTNSGRIIPSGRLLDWSYSLVLERSVDIVAFQIVQETLMSIVIRILPRSSLKESELHLIKKDFQRNISNEFNVTIKLVDQISKTNSGKFIPIYSKVIRDYDNKEQV